MALRLEYPLMSCSSLSKRLVLNSAEPCIPGSVRVPLATLRDADVLLQFLGSSPVPDESLFLVCYEATGLTNAAAAWWLLVSKGWRYVCVLEGGLETWRQHADPSLRAQSEEAMSPTRKRYPTILVTDNSIETRAKQNITTDESSAHKYIYVSTALMLIQGCDLAEAKVLILILRDAGVVLEEDHETVVFGSKAHFLLLVLCSLGKRNISLGIDIGDDFRITDEDASTETQRKMSNLTVPTPEHSMRAMQLGKHLAVSMPHSYNNELNRLKKDSRSPRAERHGGSNACKGCLIL